MLDNTLDERINHLLIAIDIAINAITKLPPKDFNINHIDIFVNSYNDFRNELNRLGFINKSNIKYVENDIFTYFNEATGPAVEFFWQQIQFQSLPYKRANKMLKILKRNKINNQLELELVVDTMMPYKQSGMISEEELERLSSMINEFENRKKKR